MSSKIPERQIRAQFTDTTITVYQAYSNKIADKALAAQIFVSPFKLDRMTWIKPSFLWMMYRCGWATKPGQERVLAVEITRAGFEWALRNACLSHFDRAVHGSREDWRRRKALSPVRVQWDPERSISLERLPFRAIQIGLPGQAVRKYVSEWITRIDDATPPAHEISALVAGSDVSLATAKLPTERPYPLSPESAQAIGITPVR